MNKKGVSDVVATILIILLVLAAIIIVWQVVSKVVKGGATTIEERSKCIDVSLDFVGGSVKCALGASEQNITGKVKRAADNIAPIGMKIIAGNYVSQVEDAPGALLTISFTKITNNSVGVLWASNEEVTVKVAPVVGEDKNVLCDPTDEVKVTCA